MCGAGLFTAANVFPSVSLWKPQKTTQWDRSSPSTMTTSESSRSAAGCRRRQQLRGRILLHIIVVRDRRHRNPPWSIGGGLVRLGRHRKNNMRRGRLRRRRRRRDDDDNYQKRGWRFLHRRRERKTAHGSTRAVHAAEERPRSQRDGGVLDPAPRQII